MVYLDYNATAPIRPAVRAAVLDALETYGNPSSVHRLGRKARALIEDARERLAALLQSEPGRIVFTSGGTEANALALRGVAAATGTQRILASAVEHPSVLAHVPESNRVSVDTNGVIDLVALERMLAAARDPALVAVMAANNETGVIQPISDVIAIARRHGARVHCDAVQAFGKIALDEARGADSLSLSAHKIGGPKGTGALILAKDLEPVADQIGGGQERRRRAGTENVTGIAGFGAALTDVPALVAQSPRIAALRDGMEKSLRTAVCDIAIHGAGAPRLPNTSSLGLAGVSSETQLIGLDLAGVAVSAGAACSSGKVAASHVLLAMGVPEPAASCAIRVSLGWETSADDIARFEAAWRTLVGKHGPAEALAGHAPA
jgi:cysteine desulfurase